MKVIRTTLYDRYASAFPVGYRVIGRNSTIDVQEYNVQSLVNIEKIQFWCNKYDGQVFCVNVRYFFLSKTLRMKLWMPFDLQIILKMKIIIKVRWNMFRESCVNVCMNLSVH